jgi:hypothetical protein
VHHERESQPPTNRVSDIIADHSANTSNGNHAGDVEFATGAGVNRSRNEGSFAG